MSAEHDKNTRKNQKEQLQTQVSQYQNFPLILAFFKLASQGFNLKFQSNFVGKFSEFQI